ncbi:CPBP family intramembrane metalloprotease [Naumannella sp. ID2617S]|nr:CPBP family intramembrane metalloprotease [Naumannella sp. ID2617S]
MSDSSPTPPLVSPTPPSLPTAGPTAAPAHDYQQRLAIERPAAWRGILALLLLLVTFGVQMAVFGGIGIGIDLLTGRYSPANGSPTMSPALLGSSVAGLATLIPISMGIQRLMFGVPARSLHSVFNRFRWRLLGRAALVVVPVWTVYMVAFSSLIPQPTKPMPMIDVIAYAAIGLLIIPFQAAGEEYAFRGLALRVAASWGGGPRAGLVLGVLVSSLLFMVAHASTDVWLNLYYFTFGACLALIAWRTGGLELPVLVHAVNNVLATLVGLIFQSDLDKGFDRSAGAGSVHMMIPAAMLVVTAAVVWWRTGPRPVTGPAEPTR